jgi:hypothetical protein
MKNLFLLTLVLVCMIPLVNAGVITTLPSWDGTTNESPWGTVDSFATPTYGQTFTTDTDNSELNSIMFEIENNSGADLPFQAYIYSWAGDGIIGPALFTSVLQTIPSQAGYQAITIKTGALGLTPGNVYIAMFSTIDEGTGGAYADWGLITSAATYTGGSFEYNNATDFSALFSGGDVWRSNGDAAFSFLFTPETSTFTMFLGALALMLGTRSKLLERRLQ